MTQERLYSISLQDLVDAGHENVALEYAESIGGSPDRLGTCGLLVKGPEHNFDGALEQEYIRSGEILPPLRRIAGLASAREMYLEVVGGAARLLEERMQPIPAKGGHLSIA